MIPAAARREHRSRRHHPQRARRAASRSGARGQACDRGRRRRHHRAFARRPPPHPRRRYRPPQGGDRQAAQSGNGGDRGDAWRSRFAPSRMPPASCRKSAPSGPPRAGSTPRGNTSTSRRSSRNSTRPAFASHCSLRRSGGRLRRRRNCARPSSRFIPAPGVKRWREGDKAAAQARMGAHPGGRENRARSRP